jgi:hypothetical protein
MGAHLPVDGGIEFFRPRLNERGYPSRIRSRAH